MEMNRQFREWLYHFQRSWTGSWVAPVAGLDPGTKEKNLLPMPGIELPFFCCAASTLVSVLTNVFRL
jgi:hypothetical protein